MRQVSIRYSTNHLLLDILVWTFDHGCKRRSPTSCRPLEASPRKPSWYMSHCRALRRFIPMNYSIKTTHMLGQCRQETHLAQLQVKFAASPLQRERQKDRPFPWPHTREIYGELLHRQFCHSRTQMGREGCEYILYILNIKETHLRTWAAKSSGFSATLFNNFRVSSSSTG